MMNETETIAFLRMIRHDWLNQLQLVKGYLALEHNDKAQEVINQIIMQSQNEAKLSNLGIPKLAYLLLTFDRGAHPYRLDFEVIEGEMSMEGWDDILHETFQSLLAWLDDHALSTYDNAVTVTIHVQRHVTLFTLDFTGGIQTDEGMKWPDLHDSVHWEEKYIAEDEAVLTIKITER